MGSRPSNLWEPSEEDREFVLGVLKGLAPYEPSIHEDVAQETLVAAHLSGDTRLERKALLFGIARNLLRGCTRKEARLRRAATAQERLAPEIAPANAEALLTMEQRRLAVKECVEELPADLREVLTLFVVEEMPMGEIAGKLGIPINTAYNRVRRARGRLTASLKRWLARRQMKEEDLTLSALLPMLFEERESSAGDARRLVARTASQPMGRLVGGAFVVALAVASVLGAWRLWGTAVLGASLYSSIGQAAATALVVASEDRAGRATQGASRGAVVVSRAPSAAVALRGATGVVGGPRRMASSGIASGETDEMGWLRAIRVREKRRGRLRVAVERAAFGGRHPESTLGLDVSLPSPGR